MPLDTNSPPSPALPRDARIYVAGHAGLVGSALMRRLKADGCANLIVRPHAGLDLTDSTATRSFFETQRPEFVFLCASKVGGILANSTYPAEFIHDNLAIAANVVHEAWRAGVQRLLFLGSSCIYPRDCPQPMKEEHLLTGPLEPTNRPYALAKIAGIELCWSYNRQYATRYLAVMPTNLYGPGDHYDLKTSHVLPALIRKAHEAKAASRPSISVWGTGTPRREFLYSEDLTDAIMFLMTLPPSQFDALCASQDAPPLINIGCGEDRTIRELAELVAEVVGFQGRIEWDRDKPDGTPRKLLDVSHMTALGWRPNTPLREGIANAYADFLQRVAP